MYGDAVDFEFRWLIYPSPIGKGPRTVVLQVRRRLVTDERHGSRSLSWAEWEEVPEVMVGAEEED